MTPDPVAETVFRIIAGQAMIPVEAVRADSTPEGLGLDSLGMVEAIFAIEEAFDISVPFNANETGDKRFDMATVGSVVEAVRSLIGARAP